MLYWECKRRLESLREFRSLVIAYFNNISYQGWPADEPVLNEASQRARIEINKRLGDVQYSCLLMGVTCTVYYSPPPAIGGLAGEVNLLANIFDLHPFHIPSRRVIDCLDRAIGNYERHKKWLLKQMFNPFFWIRWLLAKFLSIPFKLLDVAGFDADAIEKSLIGRLVKYIMTLVAFAAALLTALYHLDLLDTLKNVVNSMMKR